MLKINVKESDIVSFKDRLITDKLLRSLKNGFITAEKNRKIAERFVFLLLLSNIEKIICSKPDIMECKWFPLLEHYIEIADRNVNEKIGKSKGREAREQLKGSLLKSRLKVIFEDVYNDFSKDFGYSFVKAMGLHTCPYCNQNYTLSVGDDTNKGLRPDIDHFLPKSEYPYFAISIYNLIPVCKQCNTKKGIKPFSIETHLHPYYEGIDGAEEIEKEVVFTFIPNSIDFIYGKEDSFEIGLRRIYNDEKAKKIEAKARKNMEDLAVDELYKLHKAHVSDMIKKAGVYNESYIQELANGYPELFNNAEEVRELSLGIYMHPKNLHKRPLSKLTKDIAEDLGLV